MYFSEPFTRTMAWFDLLLMANYKPSFIYVRGNRVNIGIGQIAMGLDKLAQRWRWSRGKVERFLNELEIDKQIVMQKSFVTTLISIVNYERYQQNSEADEQADKEADNKADSQADREALKNINNIKKVKNIIEPKGSLSDLCPTLNDEPIDFDALVKFFNETTGGIFGKVQTPLSEKRRTLVRARIREHGKKTFVDAIMAAVKSDFLKGQNGKGWTMTFDWMIKPTNFEKIITGNYGNRTTTTHRDNLGTNFIDKD